MGARALPLRAKRVKRGASLALSNAALRYLPGDRLAAGVLGFSGYLEQMLHQDSIDPEALEQGFARWVDVLETLLRADRQPTDIPAEG